MAITPFPSIQKLDSDNSAGISEDDKSISLCYMTKMNAKGLVKEPFQNCTLIENFTVSEKLGDVRSITE